MISGRFYQKSSVKCQVSRGKRQETEDFGTRSQLLNSSHNDKAARWQVPSTQAWHWRAGPAKQCTIPYFLCQVNIHHTPSSQPTVFTKLYTMDMSTLATNCQQLPTNKPTMRLFYNSLNLGQSFETMTLTGPAAPATASAFYWTTSWIDSALAYRIPYQ